MSKAKAFDLGDYLRADEGIGPYGSGVSKVDTREQIEYIDLDRIDPDPENFYSLEGLEELAANIELVGLQQPLRVRPALSGGSVEALSGAARQLPQRGSRDRYIVVSGHRRRAACLMIRDGGSDMFRNGVPCIVERGEASPEMQELRLIYANSATRVMTAAELSKQAARVEELLYKLKEQGVEFPGRMRDHVAAAVNASKTKLARLHAIRGKLVPPLLKMFDAGEINESVAYRISQEETVIQNDLFGYPRAALLGLTEKTVDGMIEAIKSRRQPVGADAPGGPSPTLHKTYIDNDGLKSYLEERAEEDEKYFEMLSEVADRFLPCIGGIPSRQEGIEALKQKHGSCHHGGTGENCLYQSSLKGLALEPEEDADVEIVRTWTEVYDLLCTIAVARLLAKDDGGRSRTPAPTEIRPTWMSGTPPRDGRYFARIDMGDGGIHEAVGSYRFGSWTVFNGPLYSGMRVIGWWPLPDKEGA